MEKNDIEILVGYFNRNKVQEIDLTNEIIKGIQCGASRRDVILTPFCQYQDNTGDNISIRNSWYSDYTGRYWMWKNICKNKKYVGWLMYRKLLDFKQKHTNTSFIQEFSSSKLSDMHKDILDVKTICELADQYDIILNQPYPETRSISDQFLMFHYDLLELWKKTLNVVYYKGGEFGKVFVQGAQVAPTPSNFRYIGLHIMRSDLYDEMCSFLFPLLFIIEDQLIMKTLTPSQQKIAMGYIAERLFGAYYGWIIRKRNLKYKDLQVLQFN